MSMAWPPEQEYPDAKEWERRHDKLKEENERLRELLTEAKDTVRASTIEVGITSSRRKYRRDLYQKIQAALAATEEKP